MLRNRLHTFARRAILLLVATGVTLGIGLATGIPKFGSYGNITTRDCSMAAVGALAQAWNLATGRPTTPLRTTPILARYREIDGGVDGGVLPSDAFDAWEQGVDGVHLSAEAELPPSDDALRTAVWQLGGVFAVVGLDSTDVAHVNQPTSATMTMSPWTVTTTPTEPATALATHSVAVVGYDANYVYLATWGSVQPVTWAWWNTHSIESWALLPRTYIVHGGSATTPLSVLDNTYFTPTALSANYGPYAS
jgi:hypothetical protein